MKYLIYLISLSASIASAADYVSPNIPTSNHNQELNATNSPAASMEDLKTTSTLSERSIASETNRDPASAPAPASTSEEGVEFWNY